MKALALLFSAAALCGCVVYDDTYPYSKPAATTTNTITATTKPTAA